MKNIHATSKGLNYKLKYEGELSLNDKNSKHRSRFQHTTKYLQGIKKEDQYKDVVDVHLQLEEEKLYEYLDYYEELFGQYIYEYRPKLRFISSLRLSNILRLLKISESEDHLYWLAVLYCEAPLPEYFVMKYK